MNPMPDPVIDEIREIRHRISAMCDHDPARLVAYYQRIQQQYADRLITSPRFAPPHTAQQLVPLVVNEAREPFPSTKVSRP
jgi:hypothetical protein